MTAIRLVRPAPSFPVCGGGNRKGGSTLRTPSQLDPPHAWQGDKGFEIQAKLNRLLGGTRSLLEELGLEVIMDADAVNPMEEEDAAEASPSQCHPEENKAPIDGASSKRQQGT